jgi:nucleotide-binding universal stress UspA family protein
MIRIQRALVPIDFSEQSKKAVQYGVEICRDRKAKLYFLHVINQRILSAIQDLSVQGYKGDFVEAVKNLAGNREQELRHFVPDTWTDGLETEYAIRKGNPAEQIMSAARELNIDMIVMGSRGHSALATVFVGSVTQNVVNHAPCPVLVVHPIEHEFIA